MNGFLTNRNKPGRKQISFYTVLFICFIVSILFVNHNYSFYDRPIAKVVQANLMEETNITDPVQNKDILYKQQLVAVLQNGEEKGQSIQLVNEYSASGAFDQEYNVGNELFVLLEKDPAGTIKSPAIILDVKRDKYVVLLAWIFIFALLIVGKRQGLFAIASFVINVLILSFALDLYVKHSAVNLLVVCGICILLFTAISLLFVSGFTEKTYAAIVATLLGTFASLAITFAIIWLTSGNGLRYEEMQFVTRPYKIVFMGGLFIGSLGAIMDVAITMSSSLFALYERNPDISFQAIKKSGREIGRDIMGTITNILFFAYISGSIPMLILFLRNASALGYTLSMNLSLEIARALAGGIGIVLTIPIGLYTTLFFIKRKKAGV
ncbi:YibE/F family protein [Sporosarcina cyprini]|uniref:YibE/F family protein n=1 Tax=Sporosarcina cyprini TaxID=2910523 RepID=UPI001EDD3B06|nr:YibE/F family protein [Sporosarcina cyprini]MCG3088455.1 YibE/F family protein [Sporosarcina cyprini]